MPDFFLSCEAETGSRARQLQQRLLQAGLSFDPLVRSADWQL